MLPSRVPRTHSQKAIIAVRSDANTLLKAYLVNDTSTTDAIGISTDEKSKDNLIKDHLHCKDQSLFAAVAVAPAVTSDEEKTDKDTGVWSRIFGSNNNQIKKQVPGEIIRGAAIAGALVAAATTMLGVPLSASTPPAAQDWDQMIMTMVQASLFSSYFSIVDSDFRDFTRSIGNSTWSILAGTSQSVGTTIFQDNHSFDAHFFSALNDMSNHRKQSLEKTSNKGQFEKPALVKDGTALSANDDDHTRANIALVREYMMKRKRQATESDHQWHKAVQHGKDRLAKKARLAEMAMMIKQHEQSLSCQPIPELPPLLPPRTTFVSHSDSTSFQTLEEDDKRSSKEVPVKEGTRIETKTNNDVAAITQSEEKETLETLPKESLLSPPMEDRDHQLKQCPGRKLDKDEILEATHKMPERATDMGTVPETNVNQLIAKTKDSETEKAAINVNEPDASLAVENVACNQPGDEILDSSVLRSKQVSKTEKQSEKKEETRKAEEVLVPVGKARHSPLFSWDKSMNDIASSQKDENLEPSCSWALFIPKASQQSLFGRSGFRTRQRPSFMKQKSTRLYMTTASNTLVDNMILESENKDESEQSMSNALDAAICRRYSCTRYQRNQQHNPEVATKADPTVLSKAMVALDIARRAPSGFNAQPYKAIMVSSPRQKERIAKHMAGRNADRVLDSDCTAIFLADREVGREMPKFRRFLQAHDPKWKNKKRQLFLIQLYINLFSSGYALPRVLAVPVSFCVRTGVWICSKFLSSFTVWPSLGNAETWCTKNTMLFAMTYILGCTARHLATTPMEGFNASGIRRELKIPRRYSIPLVVATGIAFENNNESDDANISHGQMGTENSTPRYAKEDVIFGNEFGQPVST